jgi:hypothetical protein
MNATPMTLQNPFRASFWIAIALVGAATLSCFGYAGMQLPDETPTHQHPEVRPKAGRQPEGQMKDAEKPTRSPTSFVRTGAEHASL